MIRGIPSENDFFDHGLDYLNLGWGTILGLCLDIAEVEEGTGGVEPEMKADFWEAAERELATGLSLIEQGAEFLLKSRICKVSPWLLISRNPSEWPRRCETEDVDYTQFRTIDAQDLLKVHNTFASERLPEEFEAVFESLRRERNSIMHTVDKNLRFNSALLIEKVLIVSDHLIGNRSWVSTRREFIERDKHSAIHRDDSEYRVALEFMTVVSLLTDSKLRKFFGFTKRQRAYGCPNCCHSSKYVTLECRTALLRPNNPSSKTIYCFICDTESTIERQDCTFEDCKGNVYDSDWDECLTCLRLQA